MAHVNNRKGISAVYFWVYEVLTSLLASGIVSRLPETTQTHREMQQFTS